MKIYDYKNEYHFCSNRVSESVKQYAFVGIAIIWIFKTTTNPGELPIIPQQFYLAAIVFCITLILDLLQYISGTLIWRHLFRSNEREHGALSKIDLTHSPKWVWPLNFFMVGKVLTLFLGYFYLLRALCQLWNIRP